jgi:two-component system CheB/CheR fusion protein
VEHDAFPIVGIGASAGGLEAISELVTGLDVGDRAAYVVIQHLDPEHKSLLTDLLSRKTTIPVAEVTQGLRVDPHHIYVIPPNTVLRVRDGSFELTPRHREGFQPHHPVDLLFHSLAKSVAEASFGVVLSGGDSDGAAGLRAIKEAGGITFAQSPSSARVPGMPESAIATGLVDFVLEPREIATELSRLITLPHMHRQASPEHGDAVQEIDDDPAALRRVYQRLRTVHGVDFSNYKRSTLRRRLARRMVLRRSNDLAEYAALVESEPAELAALYQDFLIRVTSFFRDAESFDGLRRCVFPPLCERQRGREPLRIWVPGCATGEEVYSIAMTLVDFLEERADSVRIQIFGTDVSDAAIEKARAARYAETAVSEVPPAMLDRFFVRDGEEFHISKAIRDLCIFARQDLTRDPPFSRLDLVSCRNLLIYLDPAAQRRAMSLFHYSLRPGGFLMLGPAESVGVVSDRFELLEKQPRIYARKGGIDPTIASAGADDIDTVALPGHPRKSSTSEMASQESAETEADRILLSQYAPPSVLIDNDLNIIQFRGETGPYLEHASGPPSLNLRRVARPELLVELSPAIDEAREHGRQARREGLSTGDRNNVAIEVIPLLVATERQSYLIVFEEPERSSGRRASGIAALSETEKDRRLSQLEREVSASRAYLRGTLEHHAAVQEELKSAHEEVLSANEEFQSTNEELETAKEELQASNEELVTTNDELRSRNGELALLNENVKRARDTVEKARAYAEAIIAGVRHPLLVLDGNLKILRANDAFYAMLPGGKPPHEVRSIESIGLAPWKQLDLMDELRNVLSKKVELNEYEITFERAPGAATLTMLANARRIPGDDEREARILLALEDVTERTAAARRMHDSSRRKDEFLATLAHELRNPLAPIAHSTHLLQSGVPDEMRSTLQDLIGRQTHRLVRLVDDLLDVARINRGHVEIRREIVDLVQIASNACEAALPKFADKRQTFLVELPRSPILVEGDPVRLEQACANLLDNACKYTPEHGRIDISATAEGRWVTLRVADSGIGVAKDNLDVIFDLFAQVDNSRIRSGGGLGLGLTLIRRIVELHGGRVEARSAGLGHGTAFVIRLPLAPLGSRLEAPAPAGSDAASGPSFRVLVVDDDEDVATSISLLVSSMGHDVATVHSGAAALEMAKDFRPERALIDIGLRDIDGYALARRLREIQPNCALIALTGYGGESDKAEAFNAGFNAHLVKPARPDELQDVLEKGA